MSSSISFSSDSAVNIIDGCLIFTLPAELNTEVISLMKNNILEKIHEQKLIGVILDFCSVNVIDSFEFDQIAEIIKVVELLGLKGVIVGLQPGIVSTLIYLNVNTECITTCFNLEDGLTFLNKKKVSDEKHNSYGDRENEMRLSVPNLINSESILIAESEDSHSAQYAAKNMANTAGFNITDQTLIATVASELATNILRYAEVGEIIIKIIDNNQAVGLEIEAIDNGPGIENIDEALRESFTTSKNSLGLGLSSSKRIMDDFFITSEIGKGTKIIARKWKMKNEA